MTASGQTACGAGELRLAMTEPTALDPYRSQEMEGVAVTKALYDSLVRLDAGGRLVPAAAAKWDRDAEGRRWRFEIASGGRFSTGEPVTAHSFVRAWNRATDPAAASETTYHLAGVQGFADRLHGHAPLLRGVRAVDDRTLVVDLAEPDFEFDKKTLQPIFCPVSTAAGPAGDPAHLALPIGNGPYRMAGPWRPGGPIELVRDPAYRGPRPARQERVSFRILAPEAAAERELRLYRDGALDIARLGSAAAEDVLADGRSRLVVTDLPGVMYLLPFLHHGPLADVRARRAVAMAIDRAALARDVLNGSVRAATSLLPPALGVSHVPYPERFPFDPGRARALAAEGGLGPGATLPIATNVEGGYQTWMRELASHLERNLGIHVELTSMTAAQLVAYRTSFAATGCCRAGWICDYPTADNVLFPLLHSSCTNPDGDGTAYGDNEGRYADAEFDRLVELARRTPGPAARAAVHAAAEERAVGVDVAIIPLWYTTSRLVHRDDLTGVRVDADGCLRFEEIERTAP